jgi:hypothetical protein
MDLLKEADMLWCQSSSTPIEQNHDLKELADQVPTDKGRYQMLVGRLIYFSHIRHTIIKGTIYQKILYSNLLVNC